MSTEPESEALPQTGRRKTHWPGLIWAVPLAALFIVGYLGLHAWAHRGEVITVTFRRAADARPGDTKVLYQGVEAGHLLRISPNKDGRRLDFQIRLRPEAVAGLNTNARFWLIGASPTLSDLSSLKAVVSGIAIGYAPGEGGTPATTFEGLDRAPTVLPGDRGTRYRLAARTLGSIGEGSILLFHGQPIGKVTDVEFKGSSGFRLEVFVFRPYDALIKPGARFWKISPLRFSVAGGGVTANLAPTNTLLAGGIDLEVATADVNAAQSEANSEFTLYASHGAARQGLSGPTVRYDFAFNGTAGDLDEDSPVTLLGFQIGEVESAHLAYDDVTGRPYTTVTALIYPRQLDLAVEGVGSADDWRAATDAKLRQLLHLGYRARLQQSPPLLGNLSIALAEVKGQAPADLAYGGPNPRIPSVQSSADFSDITSLADQILAKINRVPIEEIGRDLRQVTARLNTLANSPELSAGLTHLNSTLAEVDQLLTQVQPQIGPLMTKLNDAAAQISGTALAAHQLLDNGGGAEGANLAETIQQLNAAARSIRSLTDYLGRHPEALIRGKRPDQ
jgi:paraquat-inducible protein B